MSIGLLIDMFSTMKGQNYLPFCRINIDIHKNDPHIHAHEKRDNNDKWNATEIQGIIEVNWTNYRSRTIQYMHQMVVTTPYAQFLL